LHPANWEWCNVSEHGLHLRGMVGDVSNGRLLLTESKAGGDQAELLGRRVVEALFAKGAGALLKY